MENLSLTPLDYDEEGCWYALICEVYMYDLQEQYDRAIDGDADALFNLFLFCSKEDIEVNDTLTLALLEKAANQGHDEAIYHMGLNAYDKKSIAWLIQGAKQGHPDSQNELGKSYEAGKGVLRDFKSAVEWYTKAAEQDHAGAQYNLGLMFAKGRGLSKDLNEAAKWYRKAADQGNIDAQYILFMQANKLNIETEESIDWLHKSAGKDLLSNAQYNFKNNNELIEHYLESVCKGHAKAQYQLGTMYFKNGGAKDMSKAKYWIEKAYENSDKAISKKAEDFWNKNELWIFKDYSFKNITEPNYEQKLLYSGLMSKYYLTLEDVQGSYHFVIGQIFSYGLEVLKNPKKAIKHFLKSLSIRENYEKSLTPSELGALDFYEKSQTHYELGTLYFYEDSVKDLIESKYWIKKACEGNDSQMSKNAKEFLKDNKLTYLIGEAEQGESNSQNELGKSYEAGKGVLRDFKSAVEWYTKAAEQDHAGAQYNLGLMFAKGRGLSKDLNEAAKWYRKAADQGNIDAQYILFMQANKLNIETEESIDWLHKSAGKDLLSNAQYNFKNNNELIEHYLESVCKGHAKAQYQLGTMYFKNGGAKDMSKAKYWIEKAYENSDKAISKKAEDFWNKNELWIFKDYSFKNITEPNYEQKIRYAISIADDFIIGNRLNNGIGILRDLKQAIKHFTKVATNKGSAEVQYELGVIYFQENSVKDYGKSKYWINKAYEGIEPNIRKKAKVFWNKHKLWNY